MVIFHSRLSEEEIIQWLSNRAEIQGMQLQFLRYPRNFLQVYRSLSILLNEWGPKKNFSLQDPVAHPANCFPTPGFDLDHCEQLIHSQGTGTFSIEFTPRSVPKRQYGGDCIRSVSSCLAQFSTVISRTLHLTTPSRTCNAKPSVL